MHANCMLACYFAAYSMRMHNEGNHHGHSESCRGHAVSVYAHTSSSHCHYIDIISYMQVCWDMVLEHFDDACIHEGFVRFR